MSIAQHLQDAWHRQAKWLMLLRPLSCLYRAGFLFNQQCYQRGLKKTYTAPVPVMVIGNITVGGSGKTPLLIQLVKYLQAQQLRVAVISRGYGGQGPFPALVSADAPAEVVGDEPCQIVQATGVAMAVGPNRQASIELLLAQADYDLIISDDGLQHWALARQLEWIVLDNQRGLGNQKLLPEGYLREPVSRLQHGTVIEHAMNPSQALHMHLAPGAAYLLNPDQLEPSAQRFDPNAHYHAVVGIGFPQRFYQTLRSIGVTDFEQHAFPDHHQYQRHDLDLDDRVDQALDLEHGDHALDQHLTPVITTEKDAVKLLPLIQHDAQFRRPIWVLPVEAVLSEQCYQTLQQQLQALGIAISTS